MDVVASRYETQAPAERIIWLSGEIVTFVNKIGPFVWVAVILGAFSGVFFKAGRILIAPAFRPLMVFLALATAFIIWIGMRLQRVGYCGRELVISNYLRQERIPFDQIEAVEPVWWQRRRMVRIRFRLDTSFGYVIYYIPKWAAIRCLWVRPDKELQQILDASRVGDNPYSSLS